MIPIRTRLRDLRLSKGLTLAEVASRTKRTTSYISLIENGHRFGTPATVDALANAMEVTPSEMYLIMQA